MYRGFAMFTFAMHGNGSHLGVQNLLGLWELGLQDGCHYHGKSKQCNPSLGYPDPRFSFFIRTGEKRAYKKRKTRVWVPETNATPLLKERKIDRGPVFQL